MKIYYSDTFAVPLPEGHRFPMQKYALLREKLCQSEFAQLLDLNIPEPASHEQIGLVHDPDYYSRVLNGELSIKEVRRIGFPWSLELVERSRRSVGGTITACRVALSDGMAANLAGGTHHAYPDHGEGYCLLNDTAISARVIQKEQLANKILIIDCDVHQGNGTAAVFANDPNVFTFSIHGEKNFPFRKEPSDLDIALPDGSTDVEYINALSNALEHIFGNFPAQLVIYISGADAFFDDRLGRLALSKEGLRLRDRLVIGSSNSRGLPVAIVLGGGYARSIQDTVDIHFQTITTALEYQDSLEGGSVP